MFTTPRWILITLIVALALGANGQAEAGGMWWAWLFNPDPETPQLVRVYVDGTVETYDFAAPEGIDPSHIAPAAFSADGSLAAACHTRTNSIYVFDIYAETYRAYDIGAGECHLTAAAFNDTDPNLLAVGQIHYASETNRALVGELLVLDLATGEIAHRLAANTPEVAAFGQDDVERGGWMPLVTYFTRDQLVFGLTPWGTEGLVELDAIFWRLGTDQLSALPAYGKSGLDIFDPTGEIIWLDTDQTLPMREGQYVLAPFNVVMYANKTGAQYPIFHLPEYVLNTTFIDDGRRVAFRVLSSELAISSQLSGQWMALDRTGESITLPVDGEVRRLFGAPGGYVFFQRAATNDSATTPLTQLHYHSIVDNGMTLVTSVLWQSYGGPWRIAWTAPMPIAEGLVPFPALAP